MSANVVHRLATFQAHLQPLEAVLLTNPSDIAYLSNFELLVAEEREAFLVITPTQAFLIHASFSPVPTDGIFTTLSGAHVSQLKTHLAAIQKQAPFSRLLVDKTKLFADEYEAIQEVTGFSVEAFDRQWIWDQRTVKDEAEILASRTAGEIADQAWQRLQPKITAGQTEKQLQKILNQIMAELGSEQPAFPTIVAFGANGALPHHQPTDAPLTDNTPILLDFGATFHGYRSDMTRSWWFGNTPSPRFNHVKDVVIYAYNSALEFLSTRASSSELTAQSLDKICRDRIVEAGFGNQFIHTTGHGVGLDIHEPPSLYSKNDFALKSGMIITIEPGVYLPDEFGYRWENTILLTENGYEILTHHEYY